MSNEPIARPDRRPACRPRLRLLACLLALTPAMARAEAPPSTPPAPTVASLEALAALPVLENGRYMPLDTYAREKLLQFSGKSTFNKQPALRWLADLFFRPADSTGDRIFLVNHPEVAEALDIAPDPHRRYSLDQIEPALATLNQLAVAAAAIDPDQRSLVESELIRLYGNVNEFLRLARGFQFALPHQDFSVTGEAMREKLGLPTGGTPLSFMDVFLRMGIMQQVIESMQDKPPETWSADERAAFDLSKTVYQWVQHYRELPPAILPVHGHGGELWVSPWDALPFVHQDAAVRQEVTLLRDMAQAYLLGRQTAFDLAARRFRQQVLEQAGDERGLAHLDLEVLYNRLAPFYRAEMLYGLAFLFGFAAIVGGKRWTRYAALALLAAAFVPHTAGIAMRMTIMGRPPVTNLYATFLFVAWVSVLLCVALEAAHRNGLGITLAGFMGLALLMLSGRFASEGDSMGMVVAVLDSNFWLATHVVCISLGYAGCVVAGVIGHVYILQALFRPADREGLAASRWALFAVLGFGLTFSFFGTMLGGIWADQSWGRFWGWDPKENGALLIVLWCAILFHARLARMITDLGLAVGSALGIIVVVFAWLGVNLLGVGLHSYGFTSGLARGLFIYVFLQLLFLATVTPLARARLGTAP